MDRWQDRLEGVRASAWQAGDADYLRLIKPLCSLLRGRTAVDVGALVGLYASQMAEHAAHNLQNHGISAEVIDLRYISPIDWQTILSSVRKTRRLLVVHEDNRTCSLGQTVISECLSNLDIWKTLIAPPKLICRDDIHVAYNANLESLSLPQTHHIIEAVLEMVIKK